MTNAEDAPRPLVRVLLDMDGVLNALPGSPDDWIDWRDGEAQGFAITWSPTVARFIRGLAETPGVEVAWLTTWEDLANQYISPLMYLPQLVVAGKRPFREKYGWWKFEVARNLWENDPIPFVWIDDDLGGRWDDGAEKWVQSLDGHGLGISPDTRRGLTQRLMDEIDAFVTRWRSNGRDGGG